MDVFLKFEFRVGRSPNFGATGGQKSPFPYSTHIANTTACCYRTSCDNSSRIRQCVCSVCIRLDCRSRRRRSLQSGSPGQHALGYEICSCSCCHNHRRCIWWIWKRDRSGPWQKRNFWFWGMNYEHTRDRRFPQSTHVELRRSLQHRHPAHLPTSVSM